MPPYGSTDDAEYNNLTTAQEAIQIDHDVLQANQPGYGTRNKVEVAFNLVNATVGAGIIGLPFAIYNAGLVFGLVASIFVALISQLGLYMLITAGHRVHIYKYADLVEYLLGRPGFWFLNTTLLFQSIGITISYYILLGDTIPSVLALYFPQYSFLKSRSTVICLVSIFLVFPLNLPRSIGRLARWSIVSVLCIPLIIIVILVRAPAYIDDDHTLPITVTGPNMCSALGIIAFAFACPHVAFSNYLSLQDQSSRGWYQTTVLATTMSWVISMVFAVTGFLVFGSNVQSNVFLNFATDDIIINIGRLVLGISMILTIPMGTYPTRECILKYFGLEHHPSQILHWIVTILVSVMLLYLGVTIRDLGNVYALVGAFAATILAWIIPGCAYLMTNKNLKSIQHSEHANLISSTSPQAISTSSSRLLALAAGLLIGWGVLVMILCCTSIVAS
ncbi:hypothetical protein K492DRAFT_146626 [Lichtheimia hyalospora FSU 10163]|nr:hypothetical protein K492DRAFT_146626 [Lichtheimia hyalospora FSU 10163]